MKKRVDGQTCQAFIPVMGKGTAVWNASLPCRGGASSFPVLAIAHEKDGRMQCEGSQHPRQRHAGHGQQRRLMSIIALVGAMFSHRFILPYIPPSPWVQCIRWNKNKR